MVLPLLMEHSSSVLIFEFSLWLENMLSTVLNEKNWDYYVSLVSATSESLLDGYLQT